MKRARGLVELTRPANSLAAGVLTFVGAFVAGFGTQEAGLLVSTGPAVRAGLAVAATVFATGAGNAVNDYFDRDVDRINAPGRPIPSGAVEPRTALTFAAVLFTVAVALALALPLLAVAIAVVNLVALVAYTEVFKGLPGVGNLVVAYLGGSTFLFGGAAVGGDLDAVVVLFALAALSTLAREIVKDVEDVAGDRENDLRTLPIAVGEPQALTVAGVALAVALLASPVPYILGTFGVVYLAVVIPADALMAYAMGVAFKDPTGGQARLKYGMFLAALAFIVGRLSVVVGA